jgi:hypothetical protein
MNHFADHLCLSRNSYVYPTFVCVCVCVCVCVGKTLLILFTESLGYDSCGEDIASLPGFEIGALRINIIRSG